MIQENLFASLPQFRTLVISRRKDFESLFDGFTKLKAVSYVISPDLLLEFFDRRGFTRVEALVGENLSEPYRQALAQKGVETTQRLAQLVEDGTLRIFIPERTIHTKLYILERDQGLRRVILTSANLTETARQAGRQINYAWYADLPADDRWIHRVSDDYNTHLRRSSLFMGDLMELFRQRRQEPRRNLIEAWLKGAGAEEVDIETKKVFQSITMQSLESVNLRDEPVFTVKLPDAPSARRQAEKFLAPLNPAVTDRDVRLNALAYIRYIQESQGVPLLHADPEKKEVRLGFNGSVSSRTEPLPERTQVDSALKHLEDYFQTVNYGQAPNPLFAKTSMFEALLYLLSAPFAHEYMKLKRAKYGAIDSRGPRFLYIYGPSQNGKTTFLRFTLKLITGHVMEPLGGRDFTKRKIFGAGAVGTAFPLVFDDVIPAQRYGLFEEVLKSYWEVWWKSEYVSPQIILSSNIYTLKEWVKSRVKRVDFDIHFAATSRGKERLAELFKVENPVFKWFSHLYFQNLKHYETSIDDELLTARTVMKNLYEHAGRPLPEYFPSQPIEKIYDPGLRAWSDILDRLGKASIKWDDDRALVRFSEDMQHYEIREYEGYLPQVIKFRRRGKALVIESPKEFRTWLDSSVGRSRSLLARLFRMRSGRNAR